MPGLGSLKFFRSRRLKGVRSWSVRGFRKILVLYRPIVDGIEVLGVVHGARDIKSLLMRRLRNPPEPS
jgi:toxin ParE1/3/4